MHVTEMKQIGPYHLSDAVGQAPYGAIHRAVKSESNRFVEHVLALIPSPILDPEAFGSAVTARLDWITEFSSIRHSGKMEVFQNYDGTTKVAFGYKQGRSLDAIVRKIEAEKDQGANSLEIHHVIAIAHGIAQALQAIHKGKRAHGALNPYGIWVLTSGMVEIIDAPLGQVFADMGIQKTAMGSIADCKTEFGAGWRNDQESLGALLVYLIKGSWPVRGDAASWVDGLVLSNWEETVPIPERLRTVIGRCGRRDYTSADDLLAEVTAIFNDPEYEPSTFSNAFLLESLFREELMAERGAVEEEHTYDFQLALAPEPLVREVEVEVIREVENVKKKRKNLLIAAVIAVAGTVGGLGIGWLQYQRARQQRQEQAALKREAEILVARFGLTQERHRAEMNAMMADFANAKTSSEREEIARKIEERRATQAAELEKIRQELAVVQGKQRSLGVGVGTTPSAVVHLPEPAKTVSDPGQAGAGAAQRDAIGRNEGAGVMTARDNAPMTVQRKVNDPTVTFVSSKKTPITPAGQTTAQEPTPPPPPPVPKSAYSVETLKADPSRGESGEMAAAAPVQRKEAPTVEMANKPTEDFFRKVVLPELDASVLRDYSDQVIRMDVLIEAPFGRVKMVRMLQCPPKLEKEFRKAAMQTQFNAQNSGWMSLSYRITGAGVAVGK